MPPENPIYIKVDDKSFYLAKTTSELFSVDALKQEIANHQAIIDERASHLKAASDLGVADAVTAVADLSTQPLSSVLIDVKTEPHPLTP